MNLRLPATLLPVLAFLAVAPATEAATFQTGQMRFTVSGSWVSSGTATTSCDDPATGDSRPVQYPATERVTFKGTTAGRVFYRGLVGRSIFFERVYARPKLVVRVTRTATPPVGRCEADAKTDCGSRTLTGVANEEFESEYRASRPIKLPFAFARTAKSFRFADPFKDCDLPSSGPGWWASAMSTTGGNFDFQSAALDVPSPKGFYAKRSHTFSGSATRRYKGDPGVTEGPATATLKMTVRVSRGAIRNQPAFRG